MLHINQANDVNNEQDKAYFKEKNYIVPKKLKFEDTEGRTKARLREVKHRASKKAKFENLNKAIASLCDDAPLALTKSSRPKLKEPDILEAALECVNRYTCSFLQYPWDLHPLNCLLA